MYFFTLVTPVNKESLTSRVIWWPAANTPALLYFTKQSVSHLWSNMIPGSKVSWAVWREGKKLLLITQSICEHICVNWLFQSKHMFYLYLLRKLSKLHNYLYIRLTCDLELYWSILGGKGGGRQQFAFFCPLGIRKFSITKAVKLWEEKDDLMDEWNNEWRMCL